MDEIGDYKRQMDNRKIQLCHGMYLCCPCVVTLPKIMITSSHGCNQAFIGIHLDYCSNWIGDNCDFKNNGMQDENDRI